MPMLLNIQNIYKNYGKEPMIVPVLKDVSLEVVQGDYIAIMGPSGSGKTTLMNIIGCLDRASLGTYLFEDEDISEMNDDALSDLRLNKIGFVFQNFNLLSSETAQENVALPLIYAGIDKEKRNQRAIDVLNKVGLQDRISFKPSQLSGGQKQRVAIARAIINNPKILLADEPTGALDQASGKQVMELFKSLNDEGVTIIMITHDANVASHAKKIFHIIDGEIIENKQGHIIIDHLNFSYDPSKPLIQDFNYEAKPGTMTAIVGKTGCGKTTLINLLMRFYDPQGGKITIDDVNIEDMNRDDLRKMYGMVLQDSWLFKGTIKENIAYGKTKVSDEEIIEAAKKARVHKYIMSLPQGYDTMVEEDGGNMSQGQMQLVCIARIMLTHPPMLILDEATSSIDTRTELQIQKAFDEMMKGRTTFIVAHRLKMPIKSSLWIKDIL